MQVEVFVIPCFSMTKIVHISNDNNRTQVISLNFKSITTQFMAKNLSCLTLVNQFKVEPCVQEGVLNQNYIRV